LDYFSYLLDSSIKESRICNGNHPYLISDKKLVIDAFREICRHQVYAVGVTNEQGKFIGNISVRDIRFAMSKPQETLQKSVKDFLELVSNQEGADTAYHSSLVNISNEQTVREAILLMKNCGIHNIWILGNNGEPTGVISITDICRFLNNLTLNEMVPQKPLAIEISQVGSSTESLANYEQLPSKNEESSHKLANNITSNQNI